MFSAVIFSNMRKGEGSFWEESKDSNMAIVNNKMSEITDVNVDSIIDRLLEGKLMTECIKGQVIHSRYVYSQRQ